MSESLTRLVILRRRQLEQRIQLSRSSIYDKLDTKSPRHDPSFPKPIKLGAGASAIGFIESEVDTWLAQQIANSRGKTAELK